ncbi:MAG: nucleotidyltransferase domain-containing protein [Candidatus Scalindua sp.]
MTSKDIKDKLFPILEKYKDKVIFVYLFGSASQDTMQPLSDIDIAVFLSEDIRKSYFDTKLILYADFCRVLKRNDIDIVVLNTSTNIMLLDEVIRHGLVLYDRNSDLREDFEVKVLHQAIDFKEQRLAILGI